MPMPPGMGPPQGMQGGPPMGMPQGPDPRNAGQPGFGPPPMPAGQNNPGEGPLPQVVALQPVDPADDATQSATADTLGDTATPPAQIAASAIDPSAAAPVAAVAPPSVAPQIIDAPSLSPWTLLGLAAVLGLMMYGWWNARRRSHALSLETQQLSRQQMLLKSAHLNLKAQSERLREQSILDPLTGVLNRQAFGTDLREMSGHLANYNRPLNLLVFDLDHFKSINDQQGHLAGDAALKLVVGIVREHLVSADLFGRFGGDEFLIACADQPLASCQALAEQIRSAVETRAKTHSPPLPGLTLSMGLAQADVDSGYNAEALFARADAALYEAKRRGRNCVVVADASLHMPPSASSTQRHL